MVISNFGPFFLTSRKQLWGSMLISRIYPSTAKRNRGLRRGQISFGVGSTPELWSKNFGIKAARLSFWWRLASKILDFIRFWGISGSAAD